MNSKKRKIRLLLAIVFGLFIAGTAQAETIYTENFGPGDAGNVTLNSVGWDAWYGTSATHCGHQNYVRLFVYEQAGGSTGGYMYSSPSSLNPTGLATTAEPGSVSTNILESISFRDRNANSSDTIRIVAKIGVNWYATDQAFTSDNSWTSPAQTFNWTNSASAWRNLTFTPGTVLSLGADTISSDLSGNVTEFGMYTVNDGGHMRIDDFTINVIPEPGSVVLIAAGLITLLGWMGLRRRRKQ